MTEARNARRGSCAARFAFTLVEIVVALSIILILAAVALPSLTARLDRERVSDAATQLAVVRDAIYNGAGNGFRQSIGEDPGRLSQLDSIIVSGSATYRDICGATYSGGERNSWLADGPYMTYNSERATGMMTALGLAEDTLTLVTGNPRYARITFISARLDDAEMLEMIVDGTADPNTGFNGGTVRWAPQAGLAGRVDLYYFVSIGTNTC